MDRYSLSKAFRSLLITHLSVMATCSSMAEPVFDFQLPDIDVLLWIEIIYHCTHITLSPCSDFTNHYERNTSPKKLFTIAWNQKMYRLLFHGNKESPWGLEWLEGLPAWHRWSITVNCVSAAVLTCKLCSQNRSSGPWCHI